MVQSLGMAFLFVPISTMAFAYIPKERTSYATGLFNLARNIGGSIGIATTTTMLARRAQYPPVGAGGAPDALRSRVPARPWPARRGSCTRARRLVAPDAAAQAQGMIYGVHAAAGRTCWRLRTRSG